MAGKGPRYEAKEGHRLKDGHYSKDGSRRPNSPGPPRISGFGRPSSSRLDIDGPVSSMGHPFSGPSPPMMIEQKFAIQHAEIQRLLGENQRLAVTHIALRQELTAAQQEIMHSHQSRAFGDTEKEQRFTITQVALRQELAEAKQEINRLQEAMGSVQVEKDQHIRMNLERMAKLEAELKAAEALKANFEQLRYERDELAARADHLTAEMKRLPMKEQEIATLKGEVDDLRQRHQQARLDYEHQKKMNLENLEQKQAMEKNLFTMAREVDRLRGEVVTMERKLHSVYTGQSGANVPARTQSSAQEAGSYEPNSFGVKQDISKNIKQGMEPSEGKSNAEAPKYRTGLDTFQPGIQVSVQDHPSSNPEFTGEWAQHAASNGKLFYYNAATGATQWNKPSLNSAQDQYGSLRTQMPQAQGQSGQGQNSEPVLIQTSQQASVVQRQLPPAQQPISQQAISPASMQHSGQHSLASFGINLLVLGLSEGISDRDLASLFHPYGTVLYAKVMMDTKSGTAGYCGIVTMENAQAAEAAATAVNGMFILGRNIKVELQKPKEQQLQATAPIQQQAHPQPAMQQQSMMMQGVGPIRWQPPPRPAATSGARWPY